MLEPDQPPPPPPPDTSNVDTAAATPTPSTTSTTTSSSSLVLRRPDLYIGRDFQFCHDVESCMTTALKERFDFIVVPLVHPRFRRDARGVSATRPRPFTRSDRVFPSSKWSQFVVGRTSKWFDFQSAQATVRRDSETALLQEVMWATHLAVPAIILPTPQSFRCSNYARTINRCLQQSSTLQFWVEIPLRFPECSPTTIASSSSSSSSSSSTSSTTTTASSTATDAIRTSSATTVSVENDPWEVWNRLRTLCGENRRLYVVLVVTDALCNEEELKRWASEPIRAVVLPTSIFRPNQKGFPALLPKHQKVVLQLMKAKPQFLIQGKPRHERGMLPYWRYVQFLGTKREPLTEAEQFEEPFFDYLQVCVCGVLGGYI